MHGTIIVGERRALPLILRNVRLPAITPTPTPTPTPGPTSAVIGPAGGSFSAPDGSANVAVPPGAVGQDTHFAYVPTVPVTPPDYQDAGNAFDLSAQAQGTPVAQFAQPWSGWQALQGPPGWTVMPVTGGIGWMTQNSPLQTCHPVTFIFQAPATGVGDLIWVHLTDREHRNLGNITSTRVPPPG